MALLAVDSGDDICFNSCCKEALLLPDRGVGGVEALGVSLLNGDRVLGLHYELVPAGPFAVIAAYLPVFCCLRASRRSAYLALVGQFYSVALWPFVLQFTHMAALFLLYSLVACGSKYFSYLFCLAQ